MARAEVQDHRQVVGGAPGHIEIGGGQAEAEHDLRNGVPADPGGRWDASSRPLISSPAIPPVHRNRTRNVVSSAMNTSRPSIVVRHRARGALVT